MSCKVACITVAVGTNNYPVPISTDGHGTSAIIFGRLPINVATQLTPVAAIILIHPYMTCIDCRTIIATSADCYSGSVIT